MIARAGGLARLAADNVAAHALVFAATTAGLALSLALWIAGISVAEGLKHQALAAAEAGCDLWVSRRALGRHAPLEPTVASGVEALPGVLAVEPRIVGTALAGATPVLVVGVPFARLAAASDLGSGSPPRSEGQALVGAELARELALSPGSRIALDGALLRVFEISGALSPGDAVAGAKALLIDVEEARILFGDPRASDLCVWTRPGYATAVARAALRLSPDLAVTSRAEVQAAIELAANRRGGALSLLLAPLLALSTAAFASLAWFTHARRAREIATYKLAGFTGGDVLVLTAFENALVAIVLAGTAFLVAWIWVRLLGAPLLAPFLVPDLGAFPAQAIPARFTPLPLLLGTALAFVATGTGSILAAWRLSLARSARAFA